MTDNGIRIAIAAASGWRFVWSAERQVWDLYRPDNTWAISDDTKSGCVTCSNTSIPDYPNDLNAMHEAEKMFDDVGQRKYAMELHAITRAGDTFGRGLNYFTISHATARQRCEAFLRTIGKWVDP